MTCQRLAVLAATFASLMLSGAMAAAQINRPAPTAAPAPESTVNEAPKVPSSVSPDATGLAIDPKSYVIGPEDILKISIWREPDLSGAVGVRPDGKITRPLIGDVQAAGLTPERLSAQLREAYSEKVRNPEITIEVIQVNSKHYSITGGVNRPGMFPLVTPLTVFDALTLAGGFKDFANKGDVRIIRADGKSILHFNWTKYTKGDKKAREANILLEPGDTIVVKE
jgi:polysaccharide export outer membrane protein